MSTLWLREPKLLIACQAGAFIGSILTLLLAIMGRSALLFSDHGLVLKNWVVMIILPSMILYLQFKLALKLHPLVRFVIISASAIALLLVAFTTPLLHELSIFNGALAAAFDAFKKAI